MELPTRIEWREVESDRWTEDIFVAELPGVSGYLLRIDIVGMEAGVMRRRASSTVFIPQLKPEMSE